MDCNRLLGLGSRARLVGGRHANIGKSKCSRRVQCTLLSLGL